MQHLGVLATGSPVEASLKRMDEVRRCESETSTVLIGVGLAVALTGVTTPALALSPSPWQPFQAQNRLARACVGCQFG
jgi:hypothetical protein